MKIDLSGKTAVVTGATGQLGRTMARTLAGAGADIVVHYLRNENKARELVGQIESLGTRCLAVQADVTDKKSVERMRDAIERSLPPPAIVVTSAVAQDPWLTVMEQTAEAYESQFGTCVLHNLNMAQAFVPAMVAAGGGRIIAINTECAMQTAPNQSAYVVAKRGMDGLLRVLAKEIGASGITVNQVAPGWTISDNDRDHGSEHQPGYEASVPLGRRGTDQEIANVVAFLASDLASFITGVFIPVCGGNVMPAI